MCIAPKVSNPPPPAAAKVAAAPPEPVKTADRVVAGNQRRKQVAQFGNTSILSRLTLPLNTGS